MDFQSHFEYLANEIAETKKEVQSLKSFVDSLSVLTSNQNSYAALMVQSINTQTGAINDLNRNLQSLYSKISDMEINQSNFEDAVQDIASEQKSISQDNAELKESLEAIKFYIQNMIGYKE